MPLQAQAAFEVVAWWRPLNLNVKKRLRNLALCDEVSFGHAFLLTLGLLVLGLSMFIWRSGNHSEWPTYAWRLLGGLVVFGIALLIVALTASAKIIEKWINTLLRH